MGQLSQDGSDLLPIAFYSKKLTPTEANFATIDREALAIYHVLDSARSWIIGQRIILFSDHLPLKFIYRNNSSNTRLMRWKLFIQDFNPEIKFIKGSANIVADWCSRFAFGDRGSPTMAMQENFALSHHNSPLPQSVPETYSPDVLEEPFETLLLPSSTDPIVVLTDCVSTEARGIMKAIVNRYPYVKDLYSSRVPESLGRPFCTVATADSIGTYKVFRGDGPPVITVFYTVYDLISNDRKTEIQEFNKIAPIDLVQLVRDDSPIQRHFYAQIGLESLLEGWTNTRPEKVYLVAFTDYTDRHRDKMVILFHQFCLGFSHLRGTPFMIGQKAFRSLNKAIFQVNNVAAMENPKLDVNVDELKLDQPWSKAKIQKAQSEDRAICALRALLEGTKFNPLDLPAWHIDQFSIINGNLYHDSPQAKKNIHQLVVPESLRDSAMLFAHETMAAHAGQAKTLDIARRCFFWPTMRKDLLEYVRCCDNCQQNKSGAALAVTPGRTYVPYLPLDTIAIDVLSIGRQGSHGFKYLLSAVDLATKFGWAMPLKGRTTTEVVAALIKHIFLIFGNPSYIVSDRGGEFTSAEMTSILKELQIKRHLCCSYNPTSNSVCERFNRSILQLLRSLLLYNEDHWDKLLPVAMGFYNSAYHMSIQNTPHYLMFLRDANIPYDTILPATPHEDPSVQNRAEEKARIMELAKTAIMSTQEKRLEDYEGKPSRRSIVIGDLVYIKNVTVNRRDHKILKKYWGPHRITDLTSNTAVIKCLRTGRVRHVSFRNIKLLHHRSVTKTENKNSEAAFPIEDDEYADFPGNTPCKEVTRHESLVNLEKNEEAHVVAGETEGSPVKTPVACEQPTGLKLDKDSEVGSDTQSSQNRPKLVPKVEKEPKFVRSLAEPIAKRTRARKAASEGYSINLSTLLTP